LTPPSALAMTLPLRDQRRLELRSRKLIPRARARGRAGEGATPLPPPRLLLVVAKARSGYLTSRYECIQ
jgi:hypothetical protein